MLQSWAQSGDPRSSLRARIILLSADGRAAPDVSTELGVGVPTVYKWCKRFRSVGLAGLVDLPRSGQPRRLSDEQRAEIVRITLHEPPLRGKRWTIRTLARSLKITQHQVRQIWAEAGLRPHEAGEEPVAASVPVATEAEAVPFARDLVRVPETATGTFWRHSIARHRAVR